MKCIYCGKQQADGAFCQFCKKKQFAENASQPQAVFGSNPQGYNGAPQGVGGAPQGFVGNPQGFVGNPQGFVGNPQGFVGNPQGFVGNPQGFVGNPQGFVGNPQGFVGNPQGFAGAPQGYAGAPQGVAGNPQGVTGNPQGRAGVSQGRADSSQGNANKQQTASNKQQSVPNKQQATNEKKAPANSGKTTSATGKKTKPAAVGAVAAAAVLCLGAVIGCVLYFSKDKSIETDANAAVTESEISSADETKPPFDGFIEVSKAQTEEDSSDSEEAIEESQISELYPDDAVDFNGHKYYLYEIALSWTEAEKYCEGLGGHLASINSSDEQKFLVSLTEKSKKKNIWVGGYVSHADADWEWIDGSAFTYKNWDVDQPDNYTGDEFYLRYANSDQVFEYWAAHKGKWIDTANNADGNDDAADAPISSFGFVCEWQ